MRLLKLLAGLLLLPACVAATLTLTRLLQRLLPEAVAAPHWFALGIGFSLWNFLYFSLARPVRAYVLAHEMTHALWGMCMGARVERLQVSARGGSVTLSKTNFLITLAPYFFPFYTLLVLAFFGLASLAADQTRWLAIWLALVGFTWGFHVTFTVSMLLIRQNDVREHGRLFSYAVIYLFNIAGIALWIAIAASPTVREFGTRFTADLKRSYAPIVRVVTDAAARFRVSTDPPAPVPIPEKGGK